MTTQAELSLFPVVQRMIEISKQAQDKYRNSFDAYSLLRAKNCCTIQVKGPRGWGHTRACLRLAQETFTTRSVFFAGDRNAQDCFKYRLRNLAIVDYINNTFEKDSILPGIHAVVVDRFSEAEEAWVEVMYDRALQPMGEQEYFFFIFLG